MRERLMLILCELERWIPPPIGWHQGGDLPAHRLTQPDGSRARRRAEARFIVTLRRLSWVGSRMARERRREPQNMRLRSPPQSPHALRQGSEPSALDRAPRHRAAAPLTADSWYRSRRAR